MKANHLTFPFAHAHFLLTTLVRTTIKMGYQPTLSGGDQHQNADDPIVIVGAACRLAGMASSLGSLWDMMKDSRTAHAKVPKDRWDADAWYHPDPDRKGSVSLLLRDKCCRILTYTAQHNTWILFGTEYSRI
jgi:hypothetical protein